MWPSMGTWQWRRSGEGMAETADNERVPLTGTQRATGDALTIQNQDNLSICLFASLGRLLELYHVSSFDLNILASAWGEVCIHTACQEDVPLHSAHSIPCSQLIKGERMAGSHK